MFMVSFNRLLHYFIQEILENYGALCKIRGFHGDDYEKYRLLGCSTVWFWFEPTLWINISPPSSGQVNNPRALVRR
jgi:hypothetical protein